MKQYVNLLPLLHSGVYACLTVNWRLSHQRSPITNWKNSLIMELITIANWKASFPSCLHYGALWNIKTWGYPWERAQALTLRWDVGCGWRWTLSTRWMEEGGEKKVLVRFILYFFFTWCSPWESTCWICIPPLLGQRLPFLWLFPPPEEQKEVLHMVLLSPSSSYAFLHGTSQAPHRWGGTGVSQAQLQKCGGESVVPDGAWPDFVVVARYGWAEGQPH